MTTPEPVAVRFDENSFRVELEDGRSLGIPLAWFPLHLHSRPDQREAVELSRDGLHWKSWTRTSRSPASSPAAAT